VTGRAHHDNLLILAGQFVEVLHQLADLYMDRAFDVAIGFDFGGLAHIHNERRIFHQHLVQVGGGHRVEFLVGGQGGDKVGEHLRHDGFHDLGNRFFGNNFFDDYFFCRFDYRLRQQVQPQALRTRSESC
jgi:hypothetical protein